MSDGDIYADGQLLLNRPLPGRDSVVPKYHVRFNAALIVTGALGFTFRSLQAKLG